MTAAELVRVKRSDLRLARIELHNAAARFGAIVNRRGIQPTVIAYDEAADALDNAARRFANAEIDLARAESVARAEELAREAQAELEAEEQARRARRSHLCVIDGGES